MESSTLEIIKTTLKNDNTLTPVDRKRLLAVIRAGGLQPNDKPTIRAGPRILRRRDVAKRLGVTVRAIDKWAREGILRRVKLPGRVRGCGFLESEVNALVTCETKESSGPYQRTGEQLSSGERQ